MNALPLAVDLDGTLVRTDTLFESIMLLAKRMPLKLVLLPIWLLGGRAHLKAQLAQLVVPDPTTLPFNEELVSWLTEQRDSGREMILCTAADQRVASAVSSHLGLFSHELASDGETNIKGHRKSEALDKYFSGREYSYAGDSSSDLPVWEAARSGVVVSRSEGLRKRAAGVCSIEKEVGSKKVSFKDITRLLRVHQWAKNALLFVPAAAAHRLTEIDLLATLLVAFVSFSLCSSSVYVLNDLLDLESDRRHARKRMRPFASGRIPIPVGMMLFPLLLLASAMLALQVGLNFLVALAAYYGLTLAYSFFLKKLVLLDCVVLAALYTMRIIAGAAAASMGLSFWLLSFSVFLFLSLAFVKRFVELQDAVEDLETFKIHGRGYYSGDMQFIQMLGIAAGFMSVLVLALYIDSTASEQLYRVPEFVWGAVVVLLFWISWIWLKAHRGEMHDDPVVFAITDGVSLASGLVFGLVVLLGSTGLGL